MSLRNISSKNPSSLKFINEDEEPFNFFHAFLHPVLSGSLIESIWPPGEDMPVPREDEIYPNRDVPEEEDYYPEEEEGIIDDPKKESEGLDFPRKGEEFPSEKEDEFPQTDPR
jgi:hypothetical protein